MLIVTAGMLAFLTPLRPPTALRTPPRHGHVLAQETANLTVGDALVGSLKWHVSSLPEAEKTQARAQWQLDALIADSAAELDALQLMLNRKLERSSKLTAKKLHLSLKQATAFHVAALNKTTYQLETVLGPSRDTVRKELRRALEDSRQRKEAKRRKAASLKGFARASSWRTANVVPVTEMPKHPIVLLSEASALVLGLMILLVAGDVATSRHVLTAPPRIAHVHMRSPHLTTDRDSQPAARKATARAASDQFDFWPPSDDLLATPAPKPAMSADEALRASWWLSLRTVLGVYLLTLAVILSNGAEDWAAMALGIDPCNDEPCGQGGSQLQPSFVRWEYDWEREAWVERSRQPRREP